MARHWAEGGKGAADLAHAVVQMCDQPNDFKFAYEDHETLWNKIKAVANKNLWCVRHHSGQAYH
ncbi:MAG: formate--tetrahydrofolate ligase [Nitrosomonadales bacterium]